VRRSIGKWVGWVLAGLVLVIATVWGSFVLYYLAPGPDGVRMALAIGFGVFGLAAVGALFVTWVRWAAAIGYAVAFAGVLAVWGSATPSNDRDWQPEVAVLPYATFSGDLVTVHNIRNFDYRSETDFTPGYYDRTFDLRRLDRVDLVATYWMGPTVAHLFLTFRRPDLTETTPTPV